MTSSYRVAIVGAGIGGLASAAMLRQAGHSVEIFERATELREVGAGLTLWPNATAVLSQIGALEQCLAASRPLRNLELRRSDGRVLMKIPTGNYPTPAIGVHRGKLHSSLLAQGRGLPIHLGRTVDRVEEDKNKIYLDGAAFDLVIAADGIRSTLRSYVDRDVRLKYSGYTIYRGVADFDEELLPAGAFTETWAPGLRFGLFPIERGCWCWYAAISQRKGDAALSPEELSRLFEGWAGHPSRIIEATREIIYNEGLTSSPAENWIRGRTVLLGDAAHPILPNLGQGACMAIEDAMVLARELSRGSDLTAQLRSYQATRKLRVTQIGRRSRMIGRITQARNPIAVAVRDKLCEFIPGRLLTYTSGQMYRMPLLTTPREKIRS